MPTLISGVPTDIRIPLDSTLTITPGASGASVALTGRQSNGSAISPRNIYVTTDVSVPANSTVTLTASGGNGSYTLPAMTGAQLSALMPLRLSNIMARGLMGTILAKVSSGSTFSYHTTTVTEQHFTRVRLWYPNMNTTECIIAQSAVAVSNAIGAEPTVGLGDEARYTPSTATWVPVTFGGAASVTLPAAVASTMNVQEPSWTCSDWIDIASIARTDGLTGDGANLPVLMMRALVNSGQVYNFTNYRVDAFSKLTSTVNKGRLWTSYRYTGDGLTTPEDFVYTTQLDTVGAFHVRFEYAGVQPGITFAVAGDSISDGAVNSAVGNYGNGWAWQAVNRLRADYPSIPIELCSLAGAGTLSTSFVKRMQAFVRAGIHYDVMIYSPFTPNDTPPSQTFFTQHMRQYAQAAALIGEGRFNTLPAAVPVVGASPWAYVAPSAGSVVVDGGTVSAVTITRPGSTAVNMPTAGSIEVLQDDIITVTYTVAPTVTHLPNGRGVVFGKPLVITTPCPNTAVGWSAAQDLFRLLERDVLLAARDSGVMVIDFDAVLSNKAVPARYVTTYTTDNTHPNEVGHAALAAVVAPVLAGFLLKSTA